MQRIITTGILITLLACNRGGNSTEKYKTEKIGRGDITMTVTATGTLSAVTTVQIGSQVSGVIASLHADFNSKVTKGQLLAELDPTPLQATVEQRQADLTKATVQTANIKITYDRQRRLAAAGLAATADVDAARAAYQASNADVQQSAAALKQARTNLSYTKIVSPIDGTVVDREYDVGQTVAASFSAPTLFSIAQDLTKMQVQADVDQSDIGRVQVGQDVTFTVDAYPEEQFKGRIAQIRLNATVTANVVSYPVIIEVPNPGERLRPKMTANVTIAVSVVKNALRVPNGALRFKPDPNDKNVTKTDTAAAGASGRRGANGGSGATSTGDEGTAPAGATTATGAPGGSGGFGGGQGRGGHGSRGGSGGASASGARQKPQVVYILGADGKLTAVTIKPGISDGRYTQVVWGKVNEGDAVVIGMATPDTKATTTTQSSSNPLAPSRGPGGGGGRGR